MITIGYDHARMSDGMIGLHIAHLRAGGKSPRTIESRRSVLRRLNQYLPFGLCFAATEQIEAWLADLQTLGRSRWTLSIYNYHVVAFYQWATTAGFLDGDPTATIPRPRKPQSIPNPVTEDELKVALALPEPIRTAAILAGFEGLRASEIAACHREHVTAEAVAVICGKGGDPGTVPTHPFVWEHVRLRAAGPLVTDRWGRVVDGHWLTMAARRHFDQAGLEGVHLHRLRHRFGTVAQEMTGDVRVTQELLRHRHVTSTQGYTLVTNERRTAAVLALPVPGTPAGL
jgi:integrase